MAEERACPDCGTPERRLSIRSSLVEYYRCDNCGGIWTIDKYHPEAPPLLVTEGRPKRA
jgi:uncharacterized Zn finger protein